MTYLRIYNQDKGFSIPMSLFGIFLMRIKSAKYSLEVFKNFFQEKDKKFF
jgi:hypothetical protein